MPIYEYACGACGKHHEIMQKISDKPLTHCPACGGTMKKMISSTSFVLKGSGWYKTDYATDRKKKSGSKEPSDSAQKDAPTPVTNAEKKAEAKAAKKERAASKP